VHIGVVSSNMGAGMGAMGGNCGAGLGDRGLLWGNDPNDLTASVAPGSAAAQDPNNPIVDGCGLLPGARWIEDVARPDGEDGRQRNYSGRQLKTCSLAWPRPWEATAAKSSTYCKPLERLSFPNPISIPPTTAFCGPTPTSSSFSSRPR